MFASLDVNKPMCAFASPAALSVTSSVSLTCLLKYVHALADHTLCLYEKIHLPSSAFRWMARSTGPMPGYTLV